VAEITVGYFLEDVGQEKFLQALIERMAQEVGLEDSLLLHDSRNATGGKGKAVTELRRFLHDVQRETETSFDILVIAIDGNCQGYQGKHKQLLDIVNHSGYGRTVVYAVPDPHIERWYLEDAEALAQAVGAEIKPDTPRYKCEKGRYKNALREAINQAGVYPPLGGKEYAKDIAEVLDLYKVGKADAGFKHFEEELRDALKRLKRITREVAEI